jgi:cystathionine beta-lyase
VRFTDVAGLAARRSEKWARYPPDVLPVWVAEMDFPVAPAVKAALHAAVDRDDLGYSPATCPALQRSFAGFAARRLGWAADPDAVTLLPDVMTGVTELLRLLVPPGSGVVINPPVYPPFFSRVAEAGCRVTEVPLTPGGALDLDGVARALAAGARAVVLCNPHNPGGRVPGRDELAALAELAASSGVWVLADEIHAPLTLAGAASVPFLTVSPAAAEWGIALTSASKTFNLAGLKAAVAVTASDWAATQVARLPGDLYDRAGLLGMLAAEAAFTDGDDWLDEVLGILDANRDLLARLLAEQLPGVTLVRPQASYLAWLDCRALGLGDDPAAVFLERGRVALSRGLDYGTQGAGFARLNLGTSPAIVAEAVRRMAAAAG